MVWFSVGLTICLGAWLSPTPPLSMESVLSQTAGLSSLSAPLPKSELRDRLDQTARSITVKVKVGRGGGSGVLTQKQGGLYTVVTNRHVVNGAAPYQIQTPDGRVYPASLLKKIDFQGNDLAILQFRSSAAYAIASLGHAKNLAVGDPLVAAGFPIDPTPATKRGFLLTSGTVSLLPAKPFVGGYRIGYTNSIVQGMSGGPVLDAEGKLVGFNSLHAHPLWGDPYIFQDGSRPSIDARSRISQSSWAIPIETLLCLTTAKIPLRFVQQPKTCNSEF